MTLLMCGSLQAQITIPAVEFTLSPNDSILFYGLDTAQLTVPQVGANVFWDFSNIDTDGFNYCRLYENTMDVDFPTANLRRPSTVNYLGMILPTYRYYTYDATGLYEDGY